MSPLLSTENYFPSGASVSDLMRRLLT